MGSSRGSTGDNVSDVGGHTGAKPSWWIADLTTHQVDAWLRKRGQAIRKVPPRPPTSSRRWYLFQKANICSKTRLLALCSTHSLPLFDTTWYIGFHSNFSHGLTVSLATVRHPLSLLATLEREKPQPPLFALENAWRLEFYSTTLYS